MKVAVIYNTREQAAGCGGGSWIGFFFFFVLSNYIVPGDSSAFMELMSSLELQISKGP